MDNDHDVAPDRLIEIFAYGIEVGRRFLSTELHTPRFGMAYHKVWKKLLHLGLIQWACGESPVSTFQRLLELEREWIETCLHFPLPIPVDSTQLSESMVIEILVGERSLYDRFASVAELPPSRGPLSVHSNYDLRLVTLLHGDMELDAYMAYFRSRPRKEKALARDFMAYGDLVAAIRSSDASRAEELALKLTTEYDEWLADHPCMFIIGEDIGQQFGLPSTIYHRYNLDLRLGVVLKACAFTCGSPKVKAWRW
jgi:hypothetical protein